MTFSDFGRTIKNAAKEGIRGGLIEGFLNGTGNSAATGKINYAETRYADNISNGNSINYNNEYDEFIRDLNNLNRTTIGKERNYLIPDKYNGYAEKSKTEKTEKTLLTRVPVTDVNLSRGQKETNSDFSQLRIPNWGYDDFINERAIWQKQIGNAFNDPAWFYFKVFFDFDTHHGLFGSIINETDIRTGENCAIRYLTYCKDMYHDEDVQSRISALYKFTSILSYICLNAPWFFKSVRGLDKLSVPVLNDFSTERYIELELMPDAIDMRLMNLMSLYKYACFDDYNHKEIIPQNLRQFNMSIVIFQAPLRYLHTSYTSQKSINVLGIDASKLGLTNGLNSGNTKYKRLNSNDFSDKMSFKIYTLYGCEFDMESFAQVIPGEMNNESPFQLGKNTLKITYSSSIEHTMNEFYEIMYGSNGFFFNNYSLYQNDPTSSATQETFKNSHNKQVERYQALIDTFGTPGTGGKGIGVFSTPKTYQHAVDASEAIMNGMFNDNSLLGDLGSNFILGLLGSDKSSYAPQGNIYGDVGIGSAYFKDKLEMLKNGIHENTMPPHYYDPERGIVYERGKPANEYSAYSTYNVTTDITNFNLGNYLYTGASSLGQSVNDNIRSLVNGSNTTTYVKGERSQFIKDPYQYNPDYLNDNEGTDEKDLQKTETRKPYNPKEALQGPVKYGLHGRNPYLFDGEGTEYADLQKPETKPPYNPENAIKLSNPKFKDELIEFKKGDKPHTEKPKETDIRLTTTRFKQELLYFKFSNKPNTKHFNDNDERLNTQEFKDELIKFKTGDKPNTQISYNPKDTIKNGNH